MKVLELMPIEDRKLDVIIIEKEYDEPYWIGDPQLSLRHQLRVYPMILKPTIAFQKFIEKLVNEAKPDFATEELGMRSPEEFYDSMLAKVFQKNGIPFFPVEIDNYAKTYLEADIEEKKRKLDEILQRLNEYEKNKKILERDYLLAYAQSLQMELEDAVYEVLFPVREKWMVMGILDIAREIKGKKNLLGIHICSPCHVEGVRTLLESMGVNVEVVKISKKVILESDKEEKSDRLTDIYKSITIQVKPIIRKATSMPHLLLLLDPEERASPFDICMAYDAGFSAVIPYEKVTPTSVRKIVQDALFSRGHKGAKYTCFFIGGKSEEKAEKILEAVKASMFPPFIAPIIIDPGGAYTTAAAMIAKAENALSTYKLGDLGDKTCVVFGTGPVGRIAAVLLARMGCDVSIVSTNPKRQDGEKYVEDIANSLLERYGVTVRGIYAPTLELRGKILKNAEVIFSAAAPGVQIIDSKTLKESKIMKVVIDINAVPPSGIEGVKPKDDMREIEDGIFSIGPLTVGKLKHKLEMEILREAIKRGEGIYDYNFALQLARRVLQGRLTSPKLEFVLSYPPSKRAR